MNTQIEHSIEADKLVDPLEVQVGGFCQQWCKLIGMPKSKKDLRMMMRRAIIVLLRESGNETRSSVELVLEEVRIYLHDHWRKKSILPEDCDALRRKAIFIEGIILADYPCR